MPQIWLLFSVSCKHIPHHWLRSRCLRWRYLMFGNKNPPPHFILLKHNAIIQSDAATALKILTKSGFKVNITASQSLSHTQWKSDLVVAPQWLLNSRWQLNLPLVPSAGLTFLPQPATEPEAAVIRLWDETAGLEVCINGPAASPDLLLLPQPTGTSVMFTAAVPASLLIYPRQCWRALR